MPAMLSPADIQVDNRNHPTSITVSLRQSKTDIFGVGVQISLGATNDVAAVLAYLALHPPSPGPLFILQNGSPLSRNYLVAHVRQALAEGGMDVSNFSGHSFRIGGAITAALASIPDSTIQSLGRWKSSGFLRYIRPPSNQLMLMTRTLAQLS